MKMKTLKFHADAFYKDPANPMFTRGQVVELDDSLGFATRWIKRGLATQIQGEVKEVPKVAEVVQAPIEIPEETQQDGDEVKPRSRFRSAKNKNSGADSL